MEFRDKFPVGKKRYFQDVRHYQNFHHLANNAVFPTDPHQKHQVRHFHTKHKSITIQEDLKPTLRDIQNLQPIAHFKTLEPTERDEFKKS